MPCSHTVGEAAALGAGGVHPSRAPLLGWGRELERTGQSLRQGTKMRAALVPCGELQPSGTSYLQAHQLAWRLCRPGAHFSSSLGLVEAVLQQRCECGMVSAIRA